VIKPFELKGRVVRLESLVPEHATELAAAAAEDGSTYAYTRVPVDLQGAQRYIESALAEQSAGRALPWAVRQHSDQRVVGTTRFLDMDVLMWPRPGPPGSGEDLSRRTTSRLPSWRSAAPGMPGTASTAVSFNALPDRPGSKLVPLLLRLAAASTASAIRSRRGVRMTSIFGSTLMDNEVGSAIYVDFLPAALADGRYVAAPPPHVVGTGLEHLQAGLDLQKRGVSASKIVVRLSAPRSK